jgi:hypothetical protein
VGASPQVIAALQADAGFSAVYSDAASSAARCAGNYTGVQRRILSPAMVQKISCICWRWLS